MLLVQKQTLVNIHFLLCFRIVWMCVIDKQLGQFLSISLFQLKNDKNRYIQLCLDNITQRRTYVFICADVWTSPKRIVLLKVLSIWHGLFFFFMKRSEMWTQVDIYKSYWKQSNDFINQEKKYFKLIRIFVWLSMKNLSIIEHNDLRATLVYRISFNYEHNTYLTASYW